LWKTRAVFKNTRLKNKMHTFQNQPRSPEILRRLILGKSENLKSIRADFFRTLFQRSVFFVVKKFCAKRASKFPEIF